MSTWPLRDKVLYPPSTVKTPVLPWFTFPKTIKKICISLDGGPNLIKQNGLSDMAGALGSQSQSACTYYRYLRDREFTDYEFHQLFPRTNYALNQLLVLDLTDQPSTARPSLKVDCEWVSNSPQQFIVVAMGIRPCTVVNEPGNFTIIEEPKH